MKVCCILSETEARLAILYGATALGLVSEMPSGPGVIAEEQIARIAASAPPEIGTFLLTCKTDANAIAAQQRRCGVNTIQLCDAIPADEYARLREGMPGVRIVQVIHVRGEASIREAETAAAHADAILLDSGDPTLAVKQLGGTGRPHDWKISRKIREAVPVPLFLAGGLTPTNAGEAIEAVGPYGLDVCSGLRTDGALDERKLAAFFEAITS